MDFRKIMALFIAMHVTLLCFSQTRVQSQDVKRISGKIYLLSNGNQYEIVENVVLAKLKAGKKIVRDDIKVIKNHSLGILEIAVPDTVKIEEYRNALEKTELFDYVEFDTYIIPCMSVNDTYYNNQWGLSRIHVDEAWNITTGSPSVKIAVIERDSFELYHPDLYYGYDTYSNLSISDYIDFSPSDTARSSHSTMVAGIIGAKTNNGIGVAGVAGGNGSEGSKIIPYRAKTASNTIDAISEAIDKGAKVINMSYSVSESNAYNQALAYAYDNGVTIVCSSGNTGYSQIDYPASNEHTIAVGAINSTNELIVSSNYGNGLDLVAPGSGIKSTARSKDNYYFTDSGTSFAAPHVSGVIALMLSVNPYLTPSGIKNILINSTIKIHYGPNTYNSSGWSEKYGYGLVNACEAVLKALNCPISGPSEICNSLSGTYSLSNLPSCCTVNWYVDNSDFSITTSGNQCVVTYTGSQGYGVANLTARVYYQGSFFKQLTKLIRTGTPDLDEIVFYNYYGEGNWIEGDAGNVAMVAGGSTPYYDQYECNIYRINNQFQEELVRHAFNYMPSFELSTAYEGWYTVYIRGINDCGYSEWSSGEIECEAPSNNGPENRGETQCFIIYDPDSNNLSVRWNEEALLQSSTIQKNTTPSTYEVQVWNETKLVKSVFSNQQETMVSLTSLPKGFYIAKVIRDGKNYAKKFAIKK